MDLDSLAGHALFELPADREPIGQNCVSPDGEWFIYIDAPAGSEFRKPCRGAKLVAYHLARGEQRVIFEVDVSDLTDSDLIPPDLLSSTGENDLLTPGVLTS